MDRNNTGGTSPHMKELDIFVFKQKAVVDSRDIAEAAAAGELLVEKDRKYKQIFREVLMKIRGDGR